MILITIAFLVAAFYQAGRAEYWKKRAVSPWETAWKDFEKRQGLTDPRHPSVIFGQDAEIGR